MAGLLGVIMLKLGTAKIGSTQTPKTCPRTRAGGAQWCRRGTCRRPGCIASAHKRTSLSLHAHPSINLLGTHASNTNDQQARKPDLERCVMCDSLLLRLTTSRGATP